MSDIRRLVRELADLRRQVAVQARASQGAHRSIVNGALRFVDADGVVRQVVGTQADGTVTTVDRNGPPPVVPSDPQVDTSPGVLVVAWDGATADASAWRADFRYVEVHVGTAADYASRPGSSSTQVGEFANTKGGRMTVAVAPGDYLVWLVAVSTSGTESAPSGGVSETVVAPSTTAGGTPIYSTDTAPTGLGPTDSGLWYDTANGNLPYYWNVDHWEPLPVGAEAIQDAAIETRHVGKGQVNPASMQVNPQGGAFANLIQDPGFADVFFRNQRLGDADPDWSFVQNTNLLTSGYATLAVGVWTPGPHTALGDYATTDNTFRRITTPSPVAIGETILAVDAAVSGLVAGKTYTLVVQPIWYAILATQTPAQTYDVGMQYLDASGGLLGSETLSAAREFSGDSLGAPIAVSAAAPTGAAKVRVTYRYRSGPAAFQAPALGDGSRPWGNIPYGPQHTYRARLSPYGAEVGDGEWFAQSYRLNTTTSGDTTVTELPVVAFNVARNTLYEATWREQQEATGTYSGWAGGDVTIRFYDAAGAEITSVLSQSQSWRDATHPEWAIKSNRFRAPADAVTAVAFLSSSPPTGANGYTRFRMPQVQVAGWYDPDTGHAAWISPAGISFQKDFSAHGSGAVDLFTFEPDYEVDNAVARTLARWYFNDIVYVADEVQLLPGAKLTGERVFAATVRQTAAQTVGQAVYTPDWTYLTFGLLEEGPTDAWSSSDPSKLVLPAPGQYAFSAGWAHSWGASTTLDCIIGVRLYNADGTVAADSLVEDRVSRPYTGSATVSGSVKCTAADQYLRVYVFHDPGGTLSTVPGKCFLSVHRTS